MVKWLREEHTEAEVEVPLVSKGDVMAWFVLPVLERVSCKDYCNVVSSVCLERLQVLCKC